jgi:hypothetical protein
MRALPFCRPGSAGILPALGPQASCLPVPWFGLLPQGRLLHLQDLARHPVGLLLELVTRIADSQLGLHSGRAGVTGAAEGAASWSRA